MRVRIQHPAFPDGKEFSITGLNAVLLNNEDVEVSDEAITQYEAVTGKKFTDTLNNSIFTGKPNEKPKEESTIVDDFTTPPEEEKTIVDDLITPPAEGDGQ